MSGSSQSGPGVVGGSGTGTGVEAISTSGPGVRATSGNGTGLSATSATAVGAVLKGGAAAVRLVPQSKAGHPRSGHHDRGELLVDSKGKLWLCTKAGTPGTWKQLAFV